MSKLESLDMQSQDQVRGIEKVYPDMTLLCIVVAFLVGYWLG